MLYRRLRNYICSVAVLGLLGAGCAPGTLPKPREPVSLQLSGSEEIQLGRILVARALQQLGGALDDPELAAYVSRTGVELVRHSDRPDLRYEFVVVNESTPNSFAFPGGTVAVTRGLLESLDSAEQLAAVLAHELGHLAARHPLQMVQQEGLLELTEAVLAEPVLDRDFGLGAQRAGLLASALLNAVHSPEQEREADRYAADLLIRAGYDPGAAVRLQEYFARRLERGVDSPWSTGLARTHPLSPTRTAALRAYLASPEVAVAEQTGRSDDPHAFARAFAGLRRNQPGYALYDQARELERWGRFAEAIALYRQANAEAPGQFPILTALGTAFLKSDDLVAGRQYLQQAIRLNGHYYRSRLGLGYLLLEEEDYALAIRELEASMALLPTLQGAYLLAGAYAGNQQIGPARTLYQAVVQADGNGRLGRAAAARLKEMEQP